MSVEAILLWNSWAARWAAPMAHACAQGAVLCLLVWALCRCLPRLSPSIQTWLWCAVMGKLCLALLLAVPVPVLPVPAKVLPTSRIDVAVTAPPASVPYLVPSQRSHARSDKATHASPVSIAPMRAVRIRPADAIATSIPPQSAKGLSSFSSLSMKGLLMALWALGLVCQAPGLCNHWREAQRLRATARPVTSEPLCEELERLRQVVGVRVRVQLAVSSQVSGPLVMGVWRPMILLPEGALETLSSEQRSMALVHELAHVRRGDLALGCLALLARSCFFFHPAVWIAYREFAVCREAACDEAVLRLMRPPLESYGRLLMAFPRLSRLSEVGVGLGSSSAYRRLQRRIAMLEQLDRVKMPAGRKGRMLWAGAALLILFALVPWLPVGAKPHPGTAGGRLEGVRLEWNGPLSGQVVTPEGKPVAGTSVFWIETRFGTPEQRRFVTETDARGHFQFPEPAPKREEYRNVTLMALAPGWGVSFGRVGSRTDAAPTVTITLRPTTTLHMTFVNHNGRPLPGLHVRAQNLIDRNTFASLTIPADVHGRWEQQTDARGQCLFPGLPQDTRVGFHIAAERYAELAFEERVNLKAEAAQDGGQVRLLPGAVVQGRVLQADGRPAGGIRVDAQAIAGADGWGTAVTDASGNYRMTRMRPGFYNISLNLQSTGDLADHITARAHEKVLVGLGATLQGLDFALIPGALVTGKVTDRVTGKPIPGVMVGIYGPAHPRSGAEVQNTLTGSDGVYRLHVPGGTQYLYVQGPARQHEPLHEGVDFTVEDGAVHTQDFSLVPAANRDLAPITIRTVGPDGKGVHAEVAVTPVTDKPGMNLVNTVQTDAQGAFVLQPNIPSVRLRARAGNTATMETTVVQSGATVTLHLTPNVLLTLSGQVQDPAGRPLANARVMLYEWHLDTGASGETLTTDAHGRYSFAGLYPDSRYSVNASANGYGQRYVGPEAHAPGAKVELAPMRLPRAASSVTGRVVDESGEPVAGQNVMLDSFQLDPRETVTDTQGRFRFAGVPEGTYRISMREDNGLVPLPPKQVHSGDHEVILVHRSASAAASGQSAQDERARQFEQRRAAVRQHAGPELKAVAWVNAGGSMPATLRGKIVVIDFWATSCGPCVASLPAVQKLADQYAGHGVAVVGLHAAGMSPAELERFLKAHHVTYPVAIDQEAPQQPAFGQTMSAYGVLGIPTVAVLDRSGVVRYLDFGLEGAAAAIGDLLHAEEGPRSSRR